jgi:hypothetical protein
VHCDFLALIESRLVSQLNLAVGISPALHLIDLLLVSDPMYEQPGDQSEDESPELPSPLCFDAGHLSLCHASVPLEDLVALVLMRPMSEHLEQQSWPYSCAYARRH